MDEENEIELEGLAEEESETEEVEPVGRKIFTYKGDPEVYSLYGKYKKGKLVLQPDFQRHFVWDSVKSSRLIESAFLDIPLPCNLFVGGERWKRVCDRRATKVNCFFLFY